MIVPAHLARDMLEKNFENIAAKLAAGGTLTAAENNLLTKQAAPPAADAPEPPPSPEDEIPAPHPDHTEATAEQITRWMALYDTQRRQLFRYLATGREKGRACPLDHPAQMPEWWARCMKQRVPQKILDAAQKAARETGVPPAEALPAPANTPPPVAAAFDFPSQVARLRAEQQRIQRQLDTARAGVLVGGALAVNQPDCESLLRQSLALTTELRKAENDLTAWMTAREQLCDTAAVRAENARIAGAIAGAVNRLVRTVRPLLPGLSDAEADHLWKAKTHECFAALKAARFTHHEIVLGAD